MLDVSDFSPLDTGVALRPIMLYFFGLNIWQDAIP